ncbi:hypothetical protein GDO81_010284 [Engystomops pustulosus]|uniref:Uncharacterized protein n=1 Tax=Engystomops pustulosus TaxID=76066 RepID=A0AAV7BYF9_ENGPU|nr:hypothetical protein GDO81_010284 [Engystomops pustulosus]
MIMRVGARKGFLGCFKSRTMREFLLTSGTCSTSMCSSTPEEQRCCVTSPPSNFYCTCIILQQPRTKCSATWNWPLAPMVEAHCCRLWLLDDTVMLITVHLLHINT